MTHILFQRAEKPVDIYKVKVLYQEAERPEPFLFGQVPQALGNIFACHFIEGSLWIQFRIPDSQQYLILNE